MWVSWLKSSNRVHSNPSSPRRYNFSCSSLKDVQALFADENDPNAINQLTSTTAPSTPKTPHTPVHKSTLFNKVRLSSSLIRTWTKPRTRGQSHFHHHSTSSIPPNTSNRIVIYYTSLRIIRKTFEDCRVVRSILKSFRVKTDERDLSMDTSFLKELQNFTESRENLELPRVFIDGKYVGGAEQIKWLHESGDLKRMIEGLPLDACDGNCGVCGGYRFILCDYCDGSHKVYRGEELGFVNCAECNQNGLIRCPYCTAVMH